MTKLSAFTSKEVSRASRNVSDVVKAAYYIPITGNLTLDAILLLVTGLSESRYASLTAKSPSSSALGFYQQIGSMRTSPTFRAKVGMAWSFNSLIQAMYAAAQYSEIYNDKRFSVIAFTNNNADNLILSLRRYYIGGWGRHLNAPDVRDGLALSVDAIPIAISLTSHYANQGLAGDVNQNIVKVHYNAPDNMVFMTPALKDEFHKLPAAVQWTAINIASGYGSKAYVSSVRTSHTGNKRTIEDGPNHAAFRAVDLVLGFEDTPFKTDSKGNKITPRLWANPHIIAWLKWLALDNHLIACAVGLETDHLHIDDTHAPGIYTYPTFRPHMVNDKTEHQWGKYLPPTELKLICPIPTSILPRVPDTETVNRTKFAKPKFFTNDFDSFVSEKEVCHD